MFDMNARARMWSFALPTCPNAQTHHCAEPRPLSRQKLRLLRIHALPSRFFFSPRIRFPGTGTGYITSCGINGGSTFTTVSTCGGSGPRITLFYNRPRRIRSKSGRLIYCPLHNTKVSQADCESRRMWILKPKNGTSVHWGVPGLP